MKNRHPEIRMQYDHSFFSEPVELQHIKLIQIGEICLEPSAQVGVHKQSCSEISYIIAGNGVFELNGKTVNVKAGDIIVSPAKGDHRIRANHQEKLFYAYLGFCIKDTNGFDDTVKACFSKECELCERDIHGIYAYFRRAIDEFYQFQTPDLLMVESTLIPLIVWTSRTFSDIPCFSVAKSDTMGAGEVAYRVSKYIDSYHSSVPTVRQIARALGYSPYYLSHVFKEKMGVNLQQYIGELQMEKAQDLLRLNRHSVTEVAEMVGYQNLQSFSRAFRKKVGMTPSAFAAKSKDHD